MDDLAKLKEAAEKADPSLTRGASAAQVEKIIRAGMATVPYSGKADYAADAAYIVAACRAVPGLLTRLSAAEAAHASALARVAVLEGALREIDEWSRAYPLAVFPEPDFKAVRTALEAAGLTLDAVSASNMRHVVEGVGRIARAALRTEGEGQAAKEQGNGDE